MKIIKQSICFTLALLFMSFFSLGTAYSSRAASVLDSGEAGENVTWTMYDDGRLVFSGTGATKDFEDYSVGNWANYYQKLEHVIFEEGITVIGNHLFYNGRSAIYDNIKTITIPSTVSVVGLYAFTSLESLESVHISDLEKWCNIVFYGASANPLDNNVALYLNGSIVENLEIPQSITSVSDYAFKGCSSIKSVKIHKNVTAIKSFAFNSCANLKEMYFYGNAPSFGEHVFTLSSLSAYYPQNNSTWNSSVMQGYGGTVTWNSHYVPIETAPPVTDPPTTEPPATEPPVTAPPVTEPPATEPPVTEPPVTTTEVQTTEAQTTEAQTTEAQTTENTSAVQLTESALTEETTKDVTTVNSEKTTDESTKKADGTDKSDDPNNLGSIIFIVGTVIVVAAAITVFCFRKKIFVKK